MKIKNKVPISFSPEYIGFPPFIAIIKNKNSSIPQTCPIYYKEILDELCMRCVDGIDILRTKDGKRFNNLQMFYDDTQNIKLLKSRGY